jgi:hypothetical protein
LGDNKLEAGARFCANELIATVKKINTNASFL